VTFHGYHHITSSVTNAQVDHDFHVGLLGLRNVKRTVLLDGERPFYHLYYGNEYGEAGTLLTSFAFGPDKPAGRRGSGQVSSVALSVPKGCLNFWADRFGRYDAPFTEFERLGERRIMFTYPDGFDYQLIEVGRDDRLPWTQAEIPAAAAIGGTHSVTVCAREVDELDMFLREGMGLDGRDADGSVSSYTMSDGLPGQVVEIDHQPDVPQGTW
jgi:glyoxalase family protein